MPDRARDAASGTYSCSSLVSTSTAWRWLNVPRWRVLPGEANGHALRQQGAERQSFGHAVVEGALALAHFRALFEQLLHLGMDGEVGGRTMSGVSSDGAQSLLREGGIHFESGLVAAAW